MPLDNFFLPRSNKMIWITLVILVLLAILIYFFWPDPPAKIYAEIKGYENNRRIRGAAHKLREKKTKTPEEYIMLGDMLRYNLGETAEEIYAEALQLAIFAEDPLAFTINDRLRPEEPLHVPATEPPRILTDPQNVHDSNVVKQMIQRYESVRGPHSGSITRVDGAKRHNNQTYEDFKNFAPERTKKIIEGIEQNPCEYSHLRATDADVLRDVASRGPHVWPALVSNLNDAEDVCLTGRISQILDALTLVDEAGAAPICSVPILRKEIVEDAQNFLRSREYFEKADSASEEYIFAENEALQKYIREKYQTLCAPEIMQKLLAEIEL